MKILQKLDDHFRTNNIADYLKILFLVHGMNFMQIEPPKVEFFKKKFIIHQ